MIPILRGDTPFPPADQTLETTPGLLALGGDLSISRLIDAYSHGIFPWYDHSSPILWWSPNPRCVLFFPDFHCPRSLWKLWKQGAFSLRFNTDFASVIRLCAAVPRPGQGGTWLVPDMVEAYIALHKAGYAHSVEIWQEDRLVGGVYGVALGQAFFGESMFHLVPNASKLALLGLVFDLQSKNFLFLDCQQTTAHMQRFGAKEIPRKEFLNLVAKAL